MVIGDADDVSFFFFFGRKADGVSYFKHLAPCHWTSCHIAGIAYDLDLIAGDRLPLTWVKPESEPGQTDQLARSLNTFYFYFLVFHVLT